jgi:hypothetical protein
MARLNVQAAVSWTGNMPDENLLPNLSTFQHGSMVMVLSVTKEDGAVVQDVLPDHIRVEYVTRNKIIHAPTMSPGSASGTAVQIGFFDPHGPASGGASWYSCTLSPLPQGTEPSGGWPESEVFLCVTIQRGQDRGQTVVAAKYRREP